MYMVSGILIDNRNPVCFSDSMFQFAATSRLPTFAEVCGIAARHVFYGLCEESQRNMYYATLCHGFLTIPLVGKECVDYRVSHAFQRFYSVLAGCYDFLFRFISHRLAKHSFFVHTYLLSCISYYYDARGAFSAGFIRPSTAPARS